MKIIKIKRFAFIPLLFLMMTQVPVSSGGQNNAEIYKLPKPVVKGSRITFEEAVLTRRSVRSFTDAALTASEAGQLLWAAGGASADSITGPTRSYPSAGGLYPVEIYLLAGSIKDIPSGIYRYKWQTHSLEQIKQGDFRQEFSGAALRQRVIADAPASLIFTAVPSRSAGRYGERGENRYVPMDAGASVQTAHLQAAALGLGSVVIGAFTDNQVIHLLGSRNEVPMAILPVGRITAGR